MISAVIGLILLAFVAIGEPSAWRGTLVHDAASDVDVMRISERVPIRK